MWELWTKPSGRKNLPSILMNKFILFSILLISLGINCSEEKQVNITSDAYPFDSETKENLFYSLLFELRCPKCQSSNLSGSNSPISNDLKREVYELVLQGKSNEQIKSHLVNRYGNFIIYNPPVEPATYLLWFGPFALLILASLIIFLVMRRNQMIYLSSFALFILIYLVLTEKGNLFKPNINILISAFIVILTLAIYLNVLSDDSYRLANQKTALEIFLNNDGQVQEKQTEAVATLVSELIEKKDVEAGELYILARQLKNSNKFNLSLKVFEEIYKRFKDDLGGDIIAEYAQVLFISNGRQFDELLDELLTESLTRNQDNPSALTLKGLMELEKDNPKLTIELWNKAITLLNTEKEKDDLKALIEAVKKRRNQQFLRSRQTKISQQMKAYFVSLMLYFKALASYPLKETKT